jgi:hypothetical protein
VSSLCLPTFISCVKIKLIYFPPTSSSSSSSSSPSISPPLLAFHVIVNIKIKFASVTRVLMFFSFFVINIVCYLHVISINLQKLNSQLHALQVAAPPRPTQWLVEGEARNATSSQPEAGPVVRQLDMKVGGQAATASTYREAIYHLLRAVLHKP